MADIEEKEKRNIILIFISSLILTLLVLTFYNFEIIQEIIFLFSVIVLPLLTYYFYLEYLEEKKQKEIEKELPPALFQIASFPKNTPIENLISSISDSDYGELSKEFDKARNQIVSGIDVKTALKNISKRNDSFLLRRAIELIVDAYEAGTDLSKTMKEVAEECYELQAIAKQSRANLQIQKYTVLASSAILVPLILSLLLGIISSLNFNFEGISNNVGAEMLSSCIIGEEIYLIILGAMSAVFIAAQEGSRKKAVLYFAFILPLSLSIYFVVKTIKIL